MSISAVQNDSIEMIESPKVEFKDYVTEVCKRHPHFVIELPARIAEWFFTAGLVGDRFHKGFEPAVKSEYSVFFLEDLRSVAEAAIDVPKRIFECIQGKQSCNSLITPMRQTVGKIASFLNSYRDLFDFFDAIKVTTIDSSWSIVPRQVANAAGMVSSANKIYEYATDQIEAPAPILNETAPVAEKRKELTSAKNFWDFAKFVTIFALSTLSFCAAYAGISVAGGLILGFTSAILATRMISFYKELQIEELTKSQPITAQAKKLVIA